MYIFPGYVRYSKVKETIHIVSELFHNEVEISDEALQDEFCTIVQEGGCLSLSTPLKAFLHEQEFLVTNEELKTTLESINKIIENSLVITVMPTEGCNFRCTYCYETHESVSMKRETLDVIQAYLQAESPHYRSVQINWFGGEPMLCLDTVIETSGILMKLQETQDFQYRSTMTTNGYLLNLDNFKKLYHVGVRTYQITLDGWNHDKTRPHISGKGTLHQIVNNLRDISSLPSADWKFRVILRHNILPEDEDYSWYDFLYQQFGSDDRFSALIRPVGDWGGEAVHSLNILKADEAQNMCLKHISYLKQIGMKCENGSNGLFSKICYASYPHSMVFRANGRIEKCTVCLDHPQNLLGWVDRESGIQLNPDINRLWSGYDIKKECISCPDILSCLNRQCRIKPIIYGKQDEHCYSRTLSEIY